VAAIILHANPGDIQHVLVDGQFRKRDFKLIGENVKWKWEDVKLQFLEAARRIQPLVKTPAPVPEKLWGIGEMGGVDIVSTIV
jgi:hypothetical protein